MNNMNHTPICKVDSFCLRPRLISPMTTITLETGAAGVPGPDGCFTPHVLYSVLLGAIM